MVVMPDKINDELRDLPENKPFNNEDDWFADLPDFEEPASIKRAESVGLTMAEKPEEPPASTKIQFPPVRLDEPEEAPREDLPVKAKSSAEPKPPLKERVSAFFASFRKDDNGDKADKARKTTKSLSFMKKEKVKVENEPKPLHERREPAPILSQLGPIFWTISGAIAMLIALIMLVAVIVIASNAMKVTAQINEHLVGNLYDSFVAMDEASIKTTIPINTEVPAKFDVLLDTITTVNLSEDVYITSATVSLTTGGLSITNAPTNIILPKGTELPIHLVLTVPVDEMIPVEMLVEVDIPLAETDLHEPFVKLQRTIQPYYMWLWSITTPGVKAFDFPWKQ
jgi:hypothetical protein